MIDVTHKGTKVPIKMWIPENEVESNAMEQVRNVANLPFVFKHVGLMPDTHSGYRGSGRAISLL